jgi:hypothetical protein
MVDVTGAQLSSVTVPAGQSVSVTVKFVPPAVASYTGTLSATAGSVTATASLTGRGVSTALDTSLTDDVTSGYATRLHISVPKASTEMTLGRGINGTTYNGFGVSTTGDIFLNARGSADTVGSTSSLWAQAIGPVVIQSLSGNIYSLSKGANVMMGAGGATVASSAGVVIAAGFNADPIGDPDLNQQQAPFPTDKADEVAKSILKAATVGAAFDSVIALSTGIRTTIGFAKSVRTGQFTNKYGLAALTLFSAAGGFAGGIMGTISNANANKEKPDASINVPGVSIFGNGGVLICSPAFTGIYSLAGLVLGSLFPFTVGLDVESYGYKSATMTGYRNATVQSHSKTTIQSDGDVEISAEGSGGGGIPSFGIGWLERAKASTALNWLRVGKTKAGVVAMKGNAVYLGKSPSRFQDTATALSILGVARTILFTDESSDTTMSVNDQGIAALKARTKVYAHSGAYALQVEPTKVSLGRPAVPLGPPVYPAVAISDTSINLNFDATTKVTLNASGYALKGPGATRMSAYNGEVRVNGRRILLG